jgi:hypothetical protein
MTQYIATKTKNLLERVEGVSHWGALHFPGLQDPVTKAMYDHPENSYKRFHGSKTDLEQGRIILILAEVSDSPEQAKPKKPKLMFGLPKYVREFSWDNWYSRPAGHYA